MLPLFSWSTLGTIGGILGEPSFLRQLEGALPSFDGMMRVLGLGCARLLLKLPFQLHWAITQLIGIHFHFVHITHVTSLRPWALTLLVLLLVQTACWVLASENIVLSDLGCLSCWCDQWDSTHLLLVSHQLLHWLCSAPWVFYLLLFMPFIYAFQPCLFSLPIFTVT